MRHRRWIVPSIVSLSVGALVVLGCSKGTPLNPTLSSRATVAGTAASLSGRAAPGKPGYEPAWVNGQLVTINAIEVPNTAVPAKAQGDFYEVVYPNGWQNLGLAPPQCNPCDHTGDGIDPTDFHDHILDSMPGTPGGEFSPLWHVSLVLPAYNGNADHDAQVSTAYASHLPTKSESEIDALLGSKAPDGSPLAVEVDTHFYFLCAVVNQQAAR